VIDTWVLLDPATAVQEIAKNINLPHTSPQSYYMVVSAEGNNICPSDTHFKSIHWWFLIIYWTGGGQRRQADIFLHWL